MKRVQVWVEPNAMLGVTAEGATIAHAVRSAARLLGLGPGRTTSKEMLRHGEWRWTWGTTVLRVHEVRPSSGTSGTTMAHADRGNRRIELTLPADVHEGLDALASRYGSRSAAVAALVRATACVSPLDSRRAE